MANNSKAKLTAIHRYNQKTYETISTRARREQRVNDMVNIGAEKAGQSKQAYILDSILQRLDRDGITPADLPPLPEADATPEN